MTIEESYKILGLKPDATESDVRAAYKRQIKKYHPDTYKGDKNVANEKTMQINQAYRILTFKEKPTSSSQNAKTKKKKHKFFLFGIFNKIKMLFAKKDKQKTEKTQNNSKKVATEEKKIKKQKENNKLENTIIAPELILIGILAIVLFILVIWFLAAGK